MQSAMNRRKRQPQLGHWIGLGVLLLALPACQSLDGGSWCGVGRPPADSSNVTYRPIFSFLPTKTFYLSNYAGDDPVPKRPRRNPTGVPVMVPADSPPNVTVQQGTWDSE
jgi:hypothetical protein